MFLTGRRKIRPDLCSYVFLFRLKGLVVDNKRKSRAILGISSDSLVITIIHTKPIERTRVSLMLDYKKKSVTV